jgi:hypothetical protein
MSRSSGTLPRTVRAVRGPIARAPRIVLAMFRLRRADVDQPAPERDGTEVCADPACTQDSTRLPHTRAELAACQVPAQDERKSDLQPTRQVRDARPDLAPVWCPQGCGWYHSAPCYSTHHHDGWREVREFLTTRAA